MRVRLFEKDGDAVHDYEDVARVVIEAPEEFDGLLVYRLELPDGSNSYTYASWDIQVRRE